MSNKLESDLQNSQMFHPQRDEEINNDLFPEVEYKVSDYYVDLARDQDEAKKEEQRSETEMIEEFIRSSINHIQTSDVHRLLFSVIDEIQEGSVFHDLVKGIWEQTAPTKKIRETSFSLSPLRFFGRSVSLFGREIKVPNVRIKKKKLKAEYPGIKINHRPPTAEEFINNYDMDFFRVNSDGEITLWDNYYSFDELSKRLPNNLYDHYVASVCMEPLRKYFIDTIYSPKSGYSKARGSFISNGLKSELSGTLEGLKKLQENNDLLGKGFHWIIQLIPTSTNVDNSGLFLEIGVKMGKVELDIILIENGNNKRFDNFEALKVYLGQKLFTLSQKSSQESDITPHSKQPDIDERLRKRKNNELI